MPIRKRRDNACRGGAALLLLLTWGLSACGGPAEPHGNQTKNAGAAASQDSPATSSAVSPEQADSEIARLESQIERNPADDAVRRALSQAYVRRANSLLAGGSREEAEKDFRSALQHNPDNEEAQKGIASIAGSRRQEATNSNDMAAPVSIPSDATSNTAEPSPSRDERRRRP